MTMRKILLLTAASIALVSAQTAQCQLVKDGLPPAILGPLCEKYNGMPGLVDNNSRTVFINCPLVKKMSYIDWGSFFVFYRNVLKSAKTLAGLKQPGRLSVNMDCGKFVERVQGNNRVIDCRYDAGLPVPFTFVAAKDGTLTGLDVSLNVRKLYHQVFRNAVNSGRISKYYDNLVEFENEFQIAKLNYSAGPGDTVTVDGDILHIHAAAPG
jgi:ABC-type amino acid transport substrate-binding protein